MSEKPSNDNQKGTKDSPVHGPSSRKRSFRGNRPTLDHSTEDTSATAKKFARTEDDDIVIENTHGYRIIEFFSVFTALSNIVVCKLCKTKMTFNEASPAGLGFKIAVSCQCSVFYIESGPKSGLVYEINQRIVLVMQLLGIGREGLSLFCGLMDIAKTFYTNTFESCFQNVWTAAKEVYKSSIINAGREEKEKTLEDSEDGLTVSGNGTWKKRGYTSRYGVMTLAGKYSNKIIDTSVKSTYCKLCGNWFKKNEEDEELYEQWVLTDHNCPSIHDVLAAKMEIIGIKQMFGRSVEKHGVKYTRYVGDGDGPMFKGILDMDPYNTPVEKLECYIHVIKRMGLRCRNEKKKVKSLGGRRKNTLKLTDKVINKIEKYYGLAILKNQGNVDQMYNEIWATYFHMSSTDESPQHENCPTGANSWCRYRRAEAEGIDMKKFKHDYLPLDPEVSKVLHPIYTDLTKMELLTRCKLHYTQHNNESYNGLLWNFAPEHLYSGLKSIELANFFATSIFNDGMKSILKIFKTMGIIVGPSAEDYIETQDEVRAQLAEKKYEENLDEVFSQSASEQQDFLKQEEIELDEDEIIE